MPLDVPALLAEPTAPAELTAPTATAEQVLRVPPAVSRAPALPAEHTASPSPHHKNPAYPLCAQDRMIINTMSDFLRNIHDPFSRAQAHSMLRSVLILMVMVPEAPAFLQTNENLGPGLFLAMFDMAENIRRVPDDPRRQAYLATVFCAIVSRLDSEYPTDPCAFYMSHFVLKLSVKRVPLASCDTSSSFAHRSRVNKYKVV